MSFYQSSFNFDAQTLKNAGMATALQSAEEKEESWGDKCYNLLKEFVRIHRQEFMTEEFRRWAENRIAEPPSKRAYGAVIVRASKDGLITHQGYAPTNNALAHRTPASVWKSNSQ